MSTKEVFKQKMEAEVARAQIELARPRQISSSNLTITVKGRISDVNRYSHIINIYPQ